MARVSREERRKALRDRTRENYENRDSGGGTRILNLSGIDPRPTFFVPKDGEFYNIDIIPYLVKTNNHPHRMKPGYEDYLLDIWVHRKVGAGEDSYLCLKKTFGKPCPICEEADLLRQEGAAKEEVDQLAPKRRCIYNVIDLDSKDQKIQLMDVSYHLFEKLVLAAAQIKKDEIITFSDLEEGKTIKFTGKKKSMGQYSFVEFSGIGFLDRKPYDESILEESYSLDSLLVVPTYEQVRNAFHNVEEESESDDDVEEEDAPEETAPVPTRRDRPARQEAPVEKPASPERRRREVPKEEEEEVSPPAQERRPTRTVPEKPKKSGTCPYGHTFGADCDAADECPDCDIWEACATENDRLNEV